MTRASNLRGRVFAFGQVAIHFDPPIPEQPHVDASLRRHTTVAPKGSLDQFPGLGPVGCDTRRRADRKSRSALPFRIRRGLCLGAAIVYALVPLLTGHEVKSNLLVNLLLIFWVGGALLSGCAVKHRQLELAVYRGERNELQTQMQPRLDRRMQR